jgi:polar amino acid transport system ATP-binding protein
MWGWFDEDGKNVGYGPDWCKAYAAKLFDEPTSATDPEMIDEVLDVMVELADRMAIFDEGRIFEMGSPDEMLGNRRNDRTKLFLSQFLT